MNDELKQIRNLDLEKILSLIFIFIGLMNIYALGIQQEYIKNKDPKLEDTAKNIFTIGIVISIIVYIYFVNRNYKTYKNSFTSNDDSYMAGIRLLGSILVILGTLCFLYAQNESKNPVGTPPF